MSFGITELLIILAIIVLLFGTKKLRNVGSDLGGAISSFRKSMNEPPADEKIEQDDNDATVESGRIIDVEKAESEKKKA